MLAEMSAICVPRCVFSIRAAGARHVRADLLHCRAAQEAGNALGPTGALS
jgi:hypothetical protein